MNANFFYVGSRPFLGHHIHRHHNIYARTKYSWAIAKFAKAFQRRPDCREAGSQLAGQPVAEIYFEDCEASKDYHIEPISNRNFLDFRYQPTVFYYF